MARTRRLAAVAGVCALASAVVTGPASADTAEVYLGSASAKALEVSILGQSATFGVSSAKITSQLTAKADGAGQLVPQLTQFSGNQSVDISGNGASTVKPEKCAGAVAPTQTQGVLDLGLACSAVSATIIDANPVAKAEGSIADVTVSANAVLNGPLAPVTGPLQTGLQTILNAVPNTGTPVDAAKVTLNDLVTSVLKTPTLSAAIGKSTSSVVTDAGKVASEGVANGATINVLPLPQVSGLPSTDPAITVIVGAAKATATYNRSTGVSEAAFDPALVRVRFNTALTNALGTQLSALPGYRNNELTVAPGQNIVVPGTAGTPLETEIIVGAGKKVTNPDGTVGAVADGVKVHALKGVNGGILFDLAHAEAGVGGTPAQRDPVEAPRGELPRTGGTPVLPLVGAGVLALAVLVRRTFLSAAR